VLFEALGLDAEETRAVEVENDRLKSEINRIGEYAKSLEASLSLRPVELPKVKKTAKRVPA
jgi:ribosomal protein L34E